MVDITISCESRTSDRDWQNLADSAGPVGSLPSTDMSEVLSNTAPAPGVHPLPHNMAVHDWLRGRPDCAIAAQVEYITPCQHETRRREQVG